jgi:CRP-like cAMP-binding protein
MPAAPVPSFENNQLLKALSEADRDLVVPYLEAVTVRRGAVLFEAGSAVQTISFPCGHAVVSLLITMQDGRRAETATIGREGAVGGIVSNGRIPASTQAVVQIGGPVLQIESGRLQEAKRRSATLRNLLSRYGDCLLAQVLQSVACNALHPIEQRCLRWLLTLQDRLGTDELPVTHEVLAAMLGVQRTYLTRVLSALQAQGLIRVGRGRIHVLGRPEMEVSACECHAVVRHHYEAVLGGLPAGPVR